MFELRQSPEHARYLQTKGMIVEQHPDSKVFVYIIRFPIVPLSLFKLQRIEYVDVDFDWLAKLQRKHHTIISYLELLNNDYDASVLTQYGYRQGKSAMLMTKTLRVDVSQSEAKLLQQMKPKTRYNIKLAQRHGLTTEVIPLDEVLQQTELFDSVMKIINDNAKRIKVFLFSRKDVANLYTSFANKGFVVIIRNARSNILAVATYLIAGDTAYYSHNGSTLEGRQQMAPTLAIWAGMQEAKQRDLTNFDFDGIEDERFPRKRWRGFSRFKLGFGGEPIAYPEPWVKRF